MLASSQPASDPGGKWFAEPATRVRRVIASHRHRFVFLKTRKTAGTSIEIALSRFCGPEDIVTPISPEDEELRAREGGCGPQNHLTTPSAFNHMGAARVVKIIGADAWADYFTFAVERNPWDVVASSYRFSARRADWDRSFAEFVRSPRVERLARNQRIYRIGAAIAVDQLYRYEELPAALADVAARLGLPDLGLPHAKSSSGPHYRDLYGPGDAEIVAEQFALTIETLGYRF